MNPQWLELPITRINLYGPKDVRAIGILLYMCLWSKNIYLTHYHISKLDSIFISDRFTLLIIDWSPYILSFIDGEAIIIQG